MRLKVSPKEALLRIDKLVLEGDVVLCDIRSRYEQKNNQWEQKMNDPEYLAEQSQYFRIGPEPTLTDEDLDEYHEKAWKWEEKTEEELRSIYMDHSPVFLFLSTYAQARTFQNCPDLTAYFKLHDTFKAKLHLLTTYYNELKDSIKSPLVYLTDQATICFYDFSCPLKADTNEAALCDFLFQRSIGEKMEMLDAYNHITGSHNETLNANERKTVTNAYDGINRKTKQSFGFPIVAKDKMTLRLTLPARVTTNIS